MANLQKSTLFGLNVAMDNLDSLAGQMGCRSGCLPFTYLGIPIGANMNFIKSWDPVVEKFQDKLAVWKAKTLSFGGRITLIKSVLSSIPLYYFSLFKAPVHVIYKLDRIRQIFLWAGTDEISKIHWIKWERIMSPKSMGKWWWKAKMDGGGLWLDVIMAIHNKNSGPWVWASYPINGFSSKSLRQLIDCNMFQRFEENFNWNNLVPMKVNFTCWRVLLGRLPTLAALVDRKIPIMNTLCPLCGIFYEDIDHLFFKCGLVRTIFYVTLWCIWNARNKKVYNNINGEARRLVEDIKAHSFFWVKNHLKNRGLDLNNWCNFNIPDVLVPPV